jgi:uncharacterized protein
MILVLLLFVLLLLGGFVRNDFAEYAAFKRLTHSEERQRAFRRWTLKSFAFFGLGAVVVLALLGRIETLGRLPPEFAQLAAAVGRRLSGERGLSAGFVIAVSAALVAGGAIGAIVAAWRGRGKSAPVKIGDVEPLFPRNQEERRWTALLALNAGPSEELFFRLTLPLLIALATGDALLAFAASALIFGAMHFYQGWAGVIGTTLAGALFTGLYLATGTIWVPIVLHSLMNLNSLWLRPWLIDLRRAR